MSLRRIQESLKRLCDRGLLARQLASETEHGEYYYQLGRSPSAKEQISVLLNVDGQLLEQAAGSGHERFHTQQCAVWAELFKVIFPEATVLRDREILRKKKRGTAFRVEEFDLDLVPDILIEFREGESSERVHLAVEIERTQKSSKRLKEKLSKLCRKTLFDGVLYICNSSPVEQAVRRNFIECEPFKSRRIGSYSQNFLLFFNQSLDIGKGLVCVNAMGGSVSLFHWLTVCRSNPLRTRRDFHFETPASPRWEIPGEF